MNVFMRVYLGPCFFFSWGVLQWFNVEIVLKGAKTSVTLDRILCAELQKTLYVASVPRCAISEDDVRGFRLSMHTPLAAAQLF